MSQSKPTHLAARTQQRLLTLRMLQRIAHGLRELGEIVGAEVGQVRVLRPVPGVFTGIGFRGVGGQPFDSYPTREPTPELNRSGAMNGPAIQDQDDSVGGMLEQLGHEGLDLFSMEIV